MIEGSKTQEMTETGAYWANFFRFRDRYVQRLPLPLRLQYRLTVWAGELVAWLKKKQRSLEYYSNKRFGSLP
jgi:hypothetical protein